MKNWKRLLAGLLVSMMLLAGCGEVAEEAAATAVSIALEEAAEASTEPAYTAEEEAAVAASTEASAVDPNFAIDAEEENAALAMAPGPQVRDESDDENAALAMAPGPQVSTETIDEDGYYYDKDHVALYLVTYHKLPGNYITKKEAKALGWEGGALEPYAHDMAIGGDHFGNYEGTLPEDAEYHECDIDTQGKKRGAKRIIYSDDWDIYYTDDHYETFELLYEGE